MFRGFRVEGVGRDIVGRREQAERGALDDPVDVTFLGADRAVAFRDALEIALDFEADASAMTSTTIDSFVSFLFHERPL